MYLASQITGASLAEIGQSFGGRRAASVRRIIAKIQAEKPFDVHLQGILTRLEKHFKPS
jgi:chromosomal replication initiation ATPase DnaA